MLSKAQMQDIILRNIQEDLRKQIDIETKIETQFTNWFQSLVEVPKPPEADKKQEGGGEAEAKAG